MGNKESEREVERQREGKGEKTEGDRERQGAASSEVESREGQEALSKARERLEVGGTCLLKGHLIVWIHLAP